jgi:hypothetical protein
MKNEFEALLKIESQRVESEVTKDCL